MFLLNSVICVRIVSISERYEDIIMKKIITTILASLALCAVFTLSTDITSAADAVELTPEYATSNGASVYDMTGGSYDTMSTFNSGDTITISSSTPIAHLYIAWNNKTVSPWTLTLEDGSAQECGTNGYLHEYVKLDKPSTKAVINIKSDGMKICKLYAFGEGDVPSWVQQWNPPCDEADILLVSTHADDEQLFFGGIIPYYAGELGLKVQVAYYTNYWNGANIREHEKLDGLWTVGVRNISVNGDFDDIYATSLEAAKEVCRNTRGPIASIYYQGLLRYNQGLDAVEKSIVSYGSVQTGQMESGLTWIGLFIALSPMLGFMGTVVGMIAAFDAIQAAGDISPTLVAGGIKVALLTTLMGLIAAVILQLFYNYIVSKIDSLVNDMEDSSITLMDILTAYSKK